MEIYLMSGMGAIENNFFKFPQYLIESIFYIT